MRKFSLLFSMLVLVAIVLSACGGGATSTNVAESPPPVTADVTEDVSGTATDSLTEAPTDPGMTTETPGVPVTGDVNPARLSSQLDLNVWSQDGEQIGEVDDMVLDLESTRVAYVVVGTGGFLDLGERDILVPWNSLQLQSGSGDTTGGQQNAFILQTDLDVFRNAPDFDLGANLPEAGQPTGDWDIDIINYWESGGTIGGSSSTPDASATADPNATATAEEAQQGQATATGDAGQGTSLATATLEANQGTGENQAGGQALQGVVLASEVLGSSVTLSPGQGQAEGQSQPTAEPAATVDPNAAANATATTSPEQGQGVGNIEGTIDDMIVAVDTGEIQYVVVDAILDEGPRWIPVPLSFIQWDAANGAFVIKANPSAFRDAPFLENGQYPDTTVSGWDSEFATFWQNNGAGDGTEMMATPTP